MAGRDADKDFLFRRVGMLGTDPCLIHSQRKIAQLQRRAQTFAGRFAAQEIQPHFHRARIGVRVLLRMSFWPAHRTFIIARVQ